MRKTIYQRENDILRELLRRQRETAGLVQVEASSRLGKPQSYLSKIERGERRLDVLELRALCKLYGKDFRDFVAELEAALASDKSRSSPPDD